MAYEAAAAIWHNMTVAERMTVMQAVPYHKSQVKYYRACISYVQGQA